MHYTRVYYWVSSWWANRIELASLTPSRARHPMLRKLLWRKLVTLLSACSGRNSNFRCINVVFLACFCARQRARWLRVELTFNNDLRTPKQITRSWWTEGCASCLQLKMSKLKRKSICQRLRRVTRYALHSISRRRWFRGWQSFRRWRSFARFYHKKVDQMPTAWVSCLEVYSDLQSTQHLHIFILTPHNNRLEYAVTPLSWQSQYRQFSTQNHQTLNMISRACYFFPYFHLNF